MFFRITRSKGREYLRIVHGKRQDGRIVQDIIANLGRLDELAACGTLDSLLRSLQRISGRHRREAEKPEESVEVVAARPLGLHRLVGRLWELVGLPDLMVALQPEVYDVPLERSLFALVMDRVVAPHDSRPVEEWARDKHIEGADQVTRQGIVQALVWVATHQAEIEAHVQGRLSGVTPLTGPTFLHLAPQAGGRSGSTTAVAGVLHSGAGIPLACQLWMDGSFDADALSSAANRLGRGIGVESACLVADGDMIGADVTEQLSAAGSPYILGRRVQGPLPSRLQSQFTEGDLPPLADGVVGRAFEAEGRHFVVFRDLQEAVEEATERQALLEALADPATRGYDGLGDDPVAGGFLRIRRGKVSIDQARVEEARRYDGLYLVATNTALPAAEVAKQYRRLVFVADFFGAGIPPFAAAFLARRSRAVQHGQLVVGFLGLVLLAELERRLAARGLALNWPGVRDQLEQVVEVEVRVEGRQQRLYAPIPERLRQVLAAVEIEVPDGTGT